MWAAAASSFSSPVEADKGVCGAEEEWEDRRRKTKVMRKTAAIKDFRKVNMAGELDNLGRLRTM